MKKHRHFRHCFASWLRQYSLRRRSSKIPQRSTACCPLWNRLTGLQNEHVNDMLRGGGSGGEQVQSLGILIYLHRNAIAAVGRHVVNMMPVSHIKE